MATNAEEIVGTEGGTEGEGDGLSVEDIDLISSLDIDDDDTDTDNDDGGKEDVTTSSEDDKSKKDLKDDGSKEKAKSTKSKEDGSQTTDTKWFDNIKDDGLKDFVSAYDSREDLLKALGIESGEDWRASISDPKLREHANRFASISDVIKGNLDLRQQTASALVPPGKNATREERVQFATKLNKMLGVPEDPSGYSFPEPPEGTEVSEVEKASRDNWSKFFHDNHVPKKIGDAIIQRYAEEVAAGTELVAKEDEKFAEASENELRNEWGDDYEANHTIAQNTVRELFGDDLDSILTATMSNGRLLMDSPVMLRMLVRIGREMSEGGVEFMSETERETLNDQVKELRDRAEKAKESGDTRLANRLFAQEQDLLRKITGSQSIVGDGRNA